VYVFPGLSHPVATPESLVPLEADVEAVGEPDSSYIVIVTEPVPCTRTLKLTASV
jgi:hypothetical protein